MESAWPRPRKPLLSRERIVEAAGALVDADGLDALSRPAGSPPSWACAGPRSTTTSPPRTRSSTRSPTRSPPRSTSRSSPPTTGATALRLWGTVLPRRRSPRTRTSSRTWRRAPAAGRPPCAMADAVYGGLVAAGWPPARATHIGALMRYLVAGSALGSFARGFVERPRALRRRLPPPRPGPPAGRAPAERRRGRVHPRPGGAGRRPRPGLPGRGLWSSEALAKGRLMDRDRLYVGGAWVDPLGHRHDRGREPDHREDSRARPGRHGRRTSTGPSPPRAPPSAAGPHRRRPSAPPHLDRLHTALAARADEIAATVALRARHPDQGRHGGSRPDCR